MVAIFVLPFRKKISSLSGGLGTMYISGRGMDGCQDSSFTGYLSLTPSSCPSPDQLTQLKAG